MPEESLGPTPDHLLRLAAGRTTNVLLELALELELFAKLKGKAVPLAELAGTWDMPAPSARFVAQYLSNEGLLVYRDGAVSNSPLVEMTLTGDSELRFHLSVLFKYDLSLDELREQLLNPPVSQWYQVREHGKITDPRGVLRQTPDRWLLEMVTLRHEQRIQLGRALAEQYDFSAHHKLLDLGAAGGGYCIGIRQLNPHLRCVAFDLPEVIELAREKIAEAGEEEGIELVTGSFFTDDFPAGADVMLITWIHNWSPEDDRTILRKAYDALADGGVFLVNEFCFEDDWSGSIEAVFSAFLMVGEEGKSGWAPSYAEIESLLEEVGFVDLERRPRLVIARKPAAS
jgi:SAM-dependent methyltransferase